MFSIPAFSVTDELGQPAQEPVRRSTQGLGNLLGKEVTHVGAAGELMSLRPPKQ